METAVNRDHSGEILLRVSPESGRFIVEEHKKNGVVSYSTKTVRAIRNHAIEELAAMYAFAAGVI